MQVILLEKIKKLGNLGDTVKVKPGFGRNFLLPKGKAVVVSEENKAYFESRRAELEAKAKEQLGVEAARAEKLEGLEITIAARAGEEGKLYGSIGAKEIVDAIEAKGLEANKQEVQLPECPFRSLGEHEIELHLHHGEVIVKIKLSIVSE